MGRYGFGELGLLGGKGCEGVGREVNGGGVWGGGESGVRVRGRQDGGWGSVRDRVGVWEDGKRVAVCDDDRDDGEERRKRAERK
jgi:hypothetical protein